MEPEWAVIIGMGVGGLIRELYLLFKMKSHGTEANSKFAKYASAISIVFGLLIIIPFISVIGLPLGIYSYRKSLKKGPAIIGIILNLLSILIWLAVMIQQ